MPIRPHRSPRRFGTCLLALVATACSGSSATPVATERGTAAGQVTMPTSAASPADSAAPPDAVSVRFGDGRAIDAVAAPGSESTLVVTTAGWVELTSDGTAAGPLETMETAVAATAIAPDAGRLATLVGDPARIVVFDLDDESIVYDAFTDHSSSAVLSLAPTVAAGEFVLTTSGVVERWRTADDPAILLEAAVGARFETHTVDGTGSRIHVVERSADGATTLRRWRAGAGQDTIDLGLAPASQLGDLGTSPSGELVAVEVVDPEGSSRLVVASEDGTVLNDITTSGSPTVKWSVLDDGTVYLADGETVSIHEPGSATASSSVPVGDVVDILPPEPGGEDVALVSRNGGITLVGDGRVIAEFTAAAGALQTVHRPDDDTVVGVGFSGTVGRWDLMEPGAEMTVDRYAVGAVTDVDLDANGQLVAVAHDTGTVDVVNVPSGTVDSFDHGGRNVDSVAIDPSDRTRLWSGVGERLDVNAFDDTLTIWDLDTGRAERSVGGDGEFVAGCSFFRNLVRFSPSGDRVAVNSHDFTITLFDASNMSETLTLPEHGNTILDFAFSPDGQVIATSAEDWIVRFWDTRDARLLHEWVAPQGGYWAIEYSPDGTQLAAIGSTGSLSVVDPETGEASDPFDIGANWGSNVVFSSSGHHLIAGGIDGDVLVWDIADGSVAERLTGHTDAVTSVALSADGRTLLSGSDDGTARLWPLE